MWTMDQIRSAPPWLIVTVLVVIAAFLLMCGPLAGLAIERHRRRTYANMRLRAVDGESFWDGYEARPTIEVRPPSSYSKPFGALDVTFAGQPIRALPAGPAVDSSPTMIVPVVTGEGRIFEIVDVEVPHSELFEGHAPEEPDEDDAFGEDDEPETEEIIEVHEDEARWDSEGTKEWNFVEVYEADLVEPEGAAEAAFAADPLGSWVLPPEWADVEEREFDKTFRCMVALGLLTAEGFEIDTEWDNWYSNSFELEGAAQ